MKRLFLVFPNEECLSIRDEVYLQIDEKITSLLSTLYSYNVSFVCCVEDKFACKYFNDKIGRFTVEWVSVASTSDKKFLGLSSTHELSGIDTSEFIKMSLSRYKPPKQQTVNDIIAYKGARTALANNRIVYAYRKLLESSVALYSLYITDNRGSSFVLCDSPKQGDGKFIYKYNPFTNDSFVCFGGVPLGVSNVSMILGGR